MQSAKIEVFYKYESNDFAVKITLSLPIGKDIKTIQLDYDRSELEKVYSAIRQALDDQENDSKIEEE